MRWLAAAAPLLALAARVYGDSVTEDAITTTCYYFYYFYYY